MELRIWKESHEVTVEIYMLTKTFPKEELFALRSQMCRCSTSIPRNIAEGCGRNSNGEMIRFLTIATGSCSELHYQLILAKDLNYLQEEKYQDLEVKVVMVRRMISTFIKKILIAKTD